jgi:hypothetical protein
MYVSNLSCPDVLWNLKLPNFDLEFLTIVDVARNKQGK